MQGQYIFHLLPSTHQTDIRLCGKRLTEDPPRHFVGVGDFQVLEDELNIIKALFIHQLMH
jgi:hypothetical protein